MASTPPSSDAKDQHSYLIDLNVKPPRRYEATRNVSHQKEQLSRAFAEKTTSRADLKMNYDDILEELGELGPWQIFHLSLLWLPAIASGMFVLTYSFTGLEN